MENKKVANPFKKISNNQIDNLDEKVLNILRKRRYLFDTKTEYNNFIKKSDNKIEKLEKNSPPNFLIVPSYACNLNCTYCYEKTYDIQHSNIKDKKTGIDKQFVVIDHIIENIRKNGGLFPNKDIKITIMWWEPLLLIQKMIISYIIKNAEKRWYKINIITNGVEVNSFISILKNKTVEHIQITLDGTKDIHDKRRIFTDWKWSFEMIINNIKEVLCNWIKVYLRVNVDKENIYNLPKLANLIVSTFENRDNLYPYIYILQDWGCSWQQNVVEENIAIQQVFEMEKNFPNISIFRKKFHPEPFIESIFNNIPYQPVLRHCWASKNQFILDYKWNIYKCWHWIWNKDYKVWEFDDNLKFNEQNKLWQDRSTTNLKECKTCIYRYICWTWCPAATHWWGSYTDTDKPRCVDYKSLIHSLVEKYIDKY